MTDSARRREGHLLFQRSPLNATRSSAIGWLVPLLIVAAGATLLSLPASARSVDRVPPSPYDILQSRDLETPVLDAVPFCVPSGLDPALEPLLEQARAGEWRNAKNLLGDWLQGFDAPPADLVVLDAVLSARSASDREGFLGAEARLREILIRDEIRDEFVCPRFELARLLMLMSRPAEASAQLVRIEQWLEDRQQESPHAAELAFWRAEVLYRTNRPFDAHLAFRKIANAKRPRLALAARLRLTDLSFDSGKIENVSDEYEALLPRASAYGASTKGWALRASEAALDAGDASRASVWLERFLEAGPGRDARDAAEIRLADIDSMFEDPLLARKRLSGISGRRRSDPIGALAAVRAVDLGASPGSPDQRLDLLLKALRDQREGVRRYTLSVLMEELSRRGDLDGALAVSTRLAYDGVDPVVNPDYAQVLDDLLARVTAPDDKATRCREIVRALGGRYGILIERASSAKPFAELGECFENLELPWLAVGVYRTVARRYGTAGASIIALPLARSSLAVGEITLARRVSTAALEDPDDDVEAWRAVLGEADFLDERFDEAAARLRTILDSPRIGRDRGKILRMLAITLERRGTLEDAELVAERATSWLDGGGLEPAARIAMVEAAMLTAHAYRRNGRTRSANPLYRLVDRYAEAGALRSSARFWLGLAGEPGSNGESAWGEDPNVEIGSPWGRYALFERRIEGLADSYGGSVE